jgi:hypothetical protein
LVELGEAIGAQAFGEGQDFHMQGILEVMNDDFDRGGEMEHTSTSTLSGQTALIRGSPVVTQRGRYYASHLTLAWYPHSTDKSDNSQTTNLFGCKKTSKMVPPPDLAPAQNVVDVAKVAKEVILRNTNFLRPLLYTY